MTANGSKESPMLSLLMGIYQKLGSLEAVSLANRQAVVDRTELIRREVVESIAALKEDAWSRFKWVEDQIAANRQADDQRLRALEIGQGLAPKKASRLSTVIQIILKAVPVWKLVTLAVVAVITTVMHAMPAEMHALVKPIVMPILEAIKGTVK